MKFEPSSSITPESGSPSLPDAATADGVTNKDGDKRSLVHSQTGSSISSLSSSNGMLHFVYMYTVCYTHIHVCTCVCT